MVLGLEASYLEMGAEVESPPELSVVNILDRLAADFGPIGFGSTILDIVFDCLVGCAGIVFLGDSDSF